MNCGTKHRLHVPGGVRDELASKLRNAASSSSNDQEHSAITANLQYWAYWVGEIPVLWSADTDMLEAQHYSGEVLLGSLITGLESAPYRDLCACTIWALLVHRPRLVENVALTQRLRSAIASVISAASELDS